ncbi:MAG TPA: hypothetical protein VHG08_12360 [Longimicrobium sp.]|nr:hypothetical protein [Longimicrobium sp.]
MNPVENKSGVLHELTAQARLRSEQIRARAEWVDAARLRLWERMDRLRQMPSAHSSASLAVLAPHPVAARVPPEPGELPEAAAPGGD